MNRAIRDITGQVFGRLTVKERAPDKRRSSGFPQVMWLCECSCGSTCVTQSSALILGRTISCGCYKSERFRRLVTKHKMSFSPEYRHWVSLRTRCRDPNNPIYKNHAGRGIKCCERWNSFENFYADMGPRPTPKHTVERINNDGDYEPSNCRWATSAEQARNTRRSVATIINGERVWMAEASRRLGIPISTIAYRIRTGWPIERAFTEPRK